MPLSVNAHVVISDNFLIAVKCRFIATNSTTTIYNNKKKLNGTFVCVFRKDFAEIDKNYRNLKVEWLVY